jgi:two-component system, response regulator, stage 0 sporulation protein F
LIFLVVDDNRSMRETLTRFIKEEADRILECGDGKEAIDLYVRHRPDWVLIDIRMDGMNGIEATARIVESDPAAKVIIVTEYGDRFFRRAAKEAGAIGFVTKEDLAELRTIVRSRK